MKYNDNNFLVECTEEELYKLYQQAKKTVYKNYTYDEYVKLAESQGVKITDRFIIVE